MKSIVGIVLSLVFCTSTVLGQEITKKSFQLVSDSSMVIVLGTSTAHDWDTKSNTLSGNGLFLFKDEVLTGFDSVAISLMSDSFKSGKKVMDKKTRGALKAKEYPEISFELIDFNQITADSVEVQGNFTVAGVTVTKSFPSTIHVQDNNLIKVIGQQDFKMTDFDIKPPTALLGSLKTGDDVTVQFEVLFKEL